MSKKKGGACFPRAKKVFLLGAKRQTRLCRGGKHADPTPHIIWSAPCKNGAGCCGLRGHRMCQDLTYRGTFAGLKEAKPHWIIGRHTRYRAFASATLAAAGEPVRYVSRPVFSVCHTHVHRSSFLWQIAELCTMSIVYSSSSLVDGMSFLRVIGHLHHSRAEFPRGECDDKACSLRRCTPATCRQVRWPLMVRGHTWSNVGWKFIHCAMRAMCQHFRVWRGNYTSGSEIMNGCSFRWTLPLL